MVKVKNPNDIPTDTKFLLILFKVNHVHHEADRRSIEAPGHGMGEYTESIDSPEFYAFTNQLELESELVKLYVKDKNRRDISVLTISGVASVGVSLKLNLNLK